MSVLAVLLATISLLGHRAHSRTIYTQNQTIAQWVYYESKASGRTSYDALLDFLPVVQLNDPAEASKVRQNYERKIAQSDEDQKRLREKADALEAEVARQEDAADHFDFADVCLEAALVITSVTFLTKRRFYWVLGLVLAGVGVVVGSAGFFTR